MATTMAADVTGILAAGFWPAAGLAVPLAYRALPALEAWQARRPGLRLVLPAAAAASSLALIAVLRLV